MPPTDLAFPETETADIEFVLQQLAELEPVTADEFSTGCNGCHQCSKGD
jgi:hypothetical protein